MQVLKVVCSVPGPPEPGLVPFSGSGRTLGQVEVPAKYSNASTACPVRADQLELELEPKAGGLAWE